MNILDRIIAYKKEEVAVRKLFVPEEELMESILFKRECSSLKKILQEGNSTGIIAEFKRRSPSRGFINHAADVKKITGDFTKYGAAALSVLTDNHFFGGSTEDLVIARENNLPILRKDFIIDRYQLVASKAIGADIVLLIAACLPISKVKELAVFAKELGLEILLEIHEENELDHICDEIDFVDIHFKVL